MSGISQVFLLSFKSILHFGIHDGKIIVYLFCQTNFRRREKSAFDVKSSQNLWLWPQIILIKGCGVQVDSIDRLDCDILHERFLVRGNLLLLVELIYYLYFEVNGFVIISTLHTEQKIQFLLLILEPFSKLKLYCFKITQNVAFEFFNFGIFHQFLSY